MSQEFGEKTVNLGELIKAGFNVPMGFSIKAAAYAYMIESNNLVGRISKIVNTINFDNLADLEEKTSLIRALIVGARIPQDIEQEVTQNYNALRNISREEPLIAVRSSVAVSGTSISSFSGLMDTFHYIQGCDEILQKIKECWASVWTTRAVLARHEKKINHSLALITPIVQLMIDPELAGVMFTLNPITSSLDEILIESIWGLGETVVSGKETNDLYVLDKSTLSMKVSTIAKKLQMIVYDNDKGVGRRHIPVPPRKGSRAYVNRVYVEGIGNNWTPYRRSLRNSTGY
jgi:phosphoenolpyruvate synthase/pyruvate phosphate dikinase